MFNGLADVNDVDDEVRADSDRAYRAMMEVEHEQTTGHAEQQAKAGESKHSSGKRPADEKDLAGNDNGASWGTLRFHHFQQPL